MSRPAGQRLVVASLVAAHVLLSVLAMRHESPMTDEGGHWAYGRRILAGDSSFEDSPYSPGKMPISVVNALPWAAAERLGLEEPLIRLATGNRSPTPASTSVPPEQVFPVLTGRLATIPFSVLLALLVFRWSRELYGFAGGIVSLAVYAFCPNLLAYSHLVMGDLYAALGVAAASWFFWRYLKKKTWERAVASAVVLGLAQLAKYSCLFLYPVFGLVGLVAFTRQRLADGRSGDPIRWRPVLLRAVLVVGLFVVVGLAVINIGYLGQGSFDRLGSYSFQSSAFQSLQAAVLGVADPPVPLPASPLIGLDTQRRNEREGKYFANLYLLGEIRPSRRAGLEGFKSYYLVAWLFKVPIATQIFLLAALLTHATRKGRAYLTTAELALVAPLVFYILYFNLFYKAQIGIRHFFVVFPLLFVLCGAAARLRARRRLPATLAAGALGIYLVASVLSYYPHFLPYVNELVWDRTQAHKVLADSNLDMQGSEWVLEEWLAEHPGTPVNPWYIHEPGIIVVDVNQAVGVLALDKYAWLRESFEPIDHIAHSYLVYEIGPDDMDLVPHPPPPSTLERMASWIEANIPHGTGIVREDGTPPLDPRHYSTEHRPALGSEPLEVLTAGRWDYALVASAAYGRFFGPDPPSDPERDRIAARYEEIFGWPLATEFVPAGRQRGSRLALYRVIRDEVDYRTRRRWEASRASWVSDEAIRPSSPDGPLSFTRRWQFAVFGDHFEPGRYEIRIFSQPARPEAYVHVVTVANLEAGSFRVDPAVVLDLPRRDKYLLRVFLEPGASLSEVVIRPAPAGALPSEPLARGDG